jgi:hypothetical protein
MRMKASSTSPFGFLVTRILATTTTYLMGSGPPAGYSPLTALSISGIEKFSISESTAAQDHEGARYVVGRPAASRPLLRHSVHQSNSSGRNSIHSPAAAVSPVRSAKARPKAEIMPLNATNLSLT